MLVGGVWVGTIEGSPTAGSCTNGYTVIADGIDENGNPVNGYVLGRGDVEILKEDGTPIEDPTHFVTDDELDTAISSKAEISAVEEVAEDVANLANSLSDYYTKSETSSASEINTVIETKADLSSIPTKTSELSNDSGFITSASVPTKTSDLTNDSNYITSAQVEPITVFGVSGYAKKSYMAYLITPRYVSKNEIVNTAAFRGELKPNLQTNELELDLIGEIDGKFPWNLSQLFGTQYSPAVRLNWSISSIHRQRGTRW